MLETLTSEMDKAHSYGRDSNVRQALFFSKVVCQSFVVVDVM